MASAKKKWSFIAGEKGRNRVRAYEESGTGNILIEFYEQEPDSREAKRKRLSLGHSDREKAKHAAEKLAAKFREEDKQVSPQLTLKQLFDIYLREVTPQKGENKQKHDRRTAEMLLRFFGPSKKAKTLNVRDWDSFIHDRKRGAICPKNGVLGESVGSRQVRYDLKFLLAVLNWACLANGPGGTPLLERNPLKGLPLPKQSNPKRPTLTEDEYQRMRAVGPQVDWRFTLALLLAHETGHRIESIRNLRWSDFDLDNERVIWRAEHDKTRNEHLTILSEIAVAELRKAQRETGAIRETWVFPSPEDPTRPSDRHIFRKWWYRAEQLAGLPRVIGRGWHSLRRKFASELKHVPLPDLCKMGGWKSHQTILTCYQQPDEETMRRALESRKQLRVSGLD